MHCELLLVGFAAVFWVPVIQAAYTNVVQTTSGPVRGEEETFEETKYKAFRGIAYAAPPIGDLRFKAPQPPPKWTEVRDATSYGKICPQPILDKNSLKPVMVVIHEGLFIFGVVTDKTYGPQYLMQEDIVVVTFNYRIGALGFLSTNTSDASGNWGLKDQAAVLKWVHENIAQFGGDPKHVTLYGLSVGAASAHLHLFSPLSEGLFHKVILASGSIAIKWMFTAKDKNVMYSKNLTRLLGAPESDIEDPAKRVKFLRTAHYDEITEKFDNLMNTMADEDIFRLPFTPVIEDPGTPGVFLPECPKKRLIEGRFSKMPMMIGLTDLETGGGAKFPTTDHEGFRNKKINESVCDFLPLPLREPIAAKNACSKVDQDFRNVYFDGNPLDSSSLHLALLIADIDFTASMHWVQLLHAKASEKDAPIYNYLFTFDGVLSAARRKRFGSQVTGALHLDDLTYVFNKAALNITNLPATSPDIVTKNRMVRLIANFVKYGNPTPATSALIPVKWEPATPKKSTYMVIGNELKLENTFLKARMDLWDKLYQEYTGHALFS